MTSTLPDIADALYGRYGWTDKRLAAVLDVNPRRIRAWIAGEQPVPDGVWRELYELLVQKQNENARLRNAVMKQLYPEDTGT
jgi:plasmid maintenance system antidote protein VapI